MIHLQQFLVSSSRAYLSLLRQVLGPMLGSALGRLHTLKWRQKAILLLFKHGLKHTSGCLHDIACKLRSLEVLFLVYTSLVVLDLTPSVVSGLSDGRRGET